MIKLYKGDCLIESDKIKSGSVDLILTDLPYGTMKTRDYSIQPNQKQGSKTAQDHKWDTVINTDKIMQIANRILRKNGKMVLFAQDPFSTELKNKAIPNLPYNYSCVWEKSNFANCLLINKACANFYEDILIFSKTNDTEKSHVLIDYFMGELNKTGLNQQGFNNVLGNKMGRHYFTNGFQFCVPTEKNYLKLQTTGLFKMPYKEIKEIDNQFKKNFASTFNLWEGKKFKSNILKYDRSDVGHHPTQKPVLLLEDLIKTFSDEGNNVVDLTMGSGSTGVACVNTNRKFIGIEQDENYFNIATERINYTEPQTKLL
jgi:site-specific DNA-methyltransferase (adenine-specific)